MNLYVNIRNIVVSVIAVFTTSILAQEPGFVAVERDIVGIEKALSARVGVTVLDTGNNRVWNYKGNEKFPMASTFKTVACAKLLSDADSGKTALDSTVTVRQKDIVTYSPVTEKYIGKKLSLREVCSATMLTSDNTAANIVLNAVGGPAAVTTFFQAAGDNTSRLDRFEPQLNEGVPGDERDTTTPNAIAHTLNTLLFGNVLSTDSRQQLKAWMVNNQVTGNLLRSVLPEGWRIADRSGAGGYGTRNITAVVWPQDQPPVIISIYLSQTQASFAERNEAIVRIGRSIFGLYSNVRDE
ncbi:class A beta-lactamase [Endozoicomonadaceae bacterium StTr2]